MRSRALLARIDQHLERLREELEIGRQETRSLFAEMLQSNREERLRANKVLEPLIASHNKLIASHDQLVEETRAQRDALFRILDELRRPGEEPGQAPA